MTGLELVKDICKSPDYELSLEFYLKVLREVLKYGGKDLRSAPLVKKLLENLRDKTQDQVLKALEITKEKLENIDDKVIHPNYFIAVLKNQIDQKETNYKAKYSSNNGEIILQWGRSI